MLSYKNNILHINNININHIIEEYGTPVYIYSKNEIINKIRNYKNAFKNANFLLCYALKANSNLNIIKIINEQNCGFDIVSGGELFRIIKACNNTSNVIYSGINKSEIEIEFALKNNIKCFNIESEFEVNLIQKIAKKLNMKAPISIRVNPNIDAKTHPYISTGLQSSKFGIPYDNAIAIYKYAKQLSHLEIKGIDCHIGSQLTDLSPIIDATNKLCLLIDELDQLDIKLEHIDIGGGIGINYNNEKIDDLNLFAKKIIDIIQKYKNIKIIIEPGRSIVGDAGILITKVSGIKTNDKKNFVIVDAAMNDLLRPSIYNAYHEIIPVALKNISPILADVVGPICETGDFIGKDRLLKVQPGDTLAIKDTGAYAASMASNYNSRRKIAEIIVYNDKFKLIRKKETYEQLIINEIDYL